MRISSKPRAAILALMAFTLSGCLTTGPRFPTEVQQSFAEHEMRRMETEHLKLYYPEHRREEVEQIAAQLEECLITLEQKTPRVTDWGLVPIFLPEVEFNNAYVAFGPGLDPHMVIPTFFTASIFGEMGYTPSPSAIGCHEMVHYIHLTQIHGFFRRVNEIFGPSINPQVGLDLWFFEGLATYYESQLVEGVGRFGSPIWENYFAAGLAETKLDGGYLSEWHRTIPYGAHYLVGSYFVAYLAQTYGEERLWHLVDRQGTSVAFPFAVSLRFREVYGKNLERLIEEFTEAMAQRYTPRAIPAGQERIQEAGRYATFERGPKGQRAMVSSDVDAVTTLEVVDADGERLVRRRIPDLLPGRTLVAAWNIDALRFSADGSWIYFLANHQGRRASRTSLMGIEIETGRLRRIYDDLEAVGWDLSADGAAAIVAVADGDQIRLRRYDLSGGDPGQELFSLPRGAYASWIRTSPDGRHLAATIMENERWSIAVFDLSSGALVGGWRSPVPHHPVLDPVWLDPTKLLFVGTEDDRVQIFRGDLSDGSIDRLGDVPYMAFNPRPAEGGAAVEFLNRQGWGWTLDKVRADNGVPAEEIAFFGDAALGAGVAELTGYGEPDRQIQIISDESYSQLDRLFVPRLRIPSLLVGSSGDSLELMAGVGLAGRDELGFHNWAIDGLWDFDDERLSGSFAYFNTQLSPWLLSLQVANRWSTTLLMLDGDPLTTDPVAQRDRFATLRASRPFWDTPVWLEFLAVEFFREDEEGEEADRRRLLGPEIGMRYAAGRATAHGGTQWLLALTGQAGVYPEELGSDFSMAHLRGQIEVHTPLPLASRHRLRLSGRARALPGVPDDEALMRIGGFGALAPLYNSGEEEDEPLVQDLLPRGILFTESLRGYEDLGLVANQVVIGDLNYRHPFIIDRGSASSWTIFPAVFVREFGLELFGSAATLLDGEMHAALGASADLSTVVWRVPMILRYQIAQRLFDDEALVHTVVLGAGF